MSFSLKTRYADEILASFAEKLENEEFMGQFKKEAAASHEDALRDAIARGDQAECANLRNTYFGGGQGDTALQAELGAKYGDDVAIQKTDELRRALSEICDSGPGSAIPPMAADDKCEKCHCEECECDKEEDCQDCGDLEPKMDVAVAFAMDHLVKVADALDKRGFGSVAGIVDDALERLAAKKK